MEKQLRTDITIGEICQGFHYDAHEGKGLFGWNGRLVIQPEYQRNYIYEKLRMDAPVVVSVLRGFPLGLIYLVKRSEDRYEILDGQQRITSLGRFLINKMTIQYDGNEQKFFSLNPEQQELIKNTPLTIYICEGTEKEIKDWFQIVNIGGVKLNTQEMLNAVYSGPFVSALKAVYSNSLNPMQAKWGTYVKGDPKRQDVMATVLDWVSRGQTEAYMAEHRQDGNIEPVTAYFDSVIDWVSTTFVSIHAEQRGLPWGELYDRYHLTPYNPAEVDKEVGRLMADDAVTDKRGIFEYILGGCKDTRLLNIRLFDKNTIKTVYEKQTLQAKQSGTSNCPFCAAGDGENKTRIWTLGEMDADHVTAWSKGGATDIGNCQMLCKTHNRMKGNR